MPAYFTVRRPNYPTKDNLLTDGTKAKTPTHTQGTPPWKSLELKNILILLYSKQYKLNSFLILSTTEPSTFCGMWTTKDKIEFT